MSAQANSYQPIGSNNAVSVAGSIGSGSQITAAQLWQRAIDMFEENNDFWAKYEGSSDTSVIMTKTDLNAGAGQDMIIRVESGLYDEPHYGDDTFGTDDDFESLKASEYHLTVDCIRHAVSGSERTEEKMGLRGEINSKFPQKLGAWGGRVKSENLDMMFREKVNSENVIRPNGLTRDTLVKASGLSYNYVSTAASLLHRMGGGRAQTGTYQNGTPALKLVLIACNDACTILKQDSTYQDAQKYAGTRGALNPLFAGVISDLDNVTVIQRDVIDHDGEGAIGSPMNPRARLGNTTIVPGTTTTFDILGGGNATSGAIAKKFYFKHFPNHLYRFANGDTVGANGLTNYALIINPANAATDPSKIGMFSYTTGNNGNKITIVNRLAASASGANVTTLGSVTWNGGVWNGCHSATHAAGALIIPCNSKGEPIGWSFLLGQAAALRGYGKYRNRRDTETSEGGYFTKTFFRSYFGQKLRQDRSGRHPGVVVLEHSLHYPDLPLPAVV